MKGAVDVLKRAVSMRAVRYARMLPQLTREQQVALVGAMVWVPLTRLALKVLPWRWVLSAFDRTRLRSGPPDWQRANARVWAVDAVARRVFPRSPCLPQALVGLRMLRQQGIDATLRIGASVDEGGTFSAHAWLERDGRVILGENGRLPTYAPFHPLSAPPLPPIARGT